MLRRAAFMLSYNESGSREWPFSTASVSPVLKEPGYGHPIRINEPDQPSSLLPVLVLNGAAISQATALTDNREPVASITPIELNSNGAILAQQASVSVQQDGRT